MINPAQQAYLEALDIPVWVRKELADQSPGFEPARLMLGPGSGQILLVVAALEDQTTRMASDIARCLRSDPVWAWPDTGAQGGDISEVVREHLFTHVVLFGDDLAMSMFNGPVPATLGCARLVSVPSMQDLAAIPAQRQALWQLICSNGLARQATT